MAMVAATEDRRLGIYNNCEYVLPPILSLALSSVEGNEIFGRDTSLMILFKSLSVLLKRK